VRIVAMMTSPHLSLEDTLCSKVRLRILKLLVESQKLTTSEIAAKVGVNYVIARAHLNALENGGVLTHANFGKRIRYYRFKESAKAKAVWNFMEAWRCEENMKVPPHAV
jgi:predicted ArsR family transcriptional regulator